MIALSSRFVAAEFTLALMRLDIARSVIQVDIIFLRLDVSDDVRRSNRQILPRRDY